MIAESDERREQLKKIKTQLEKDHQNFMQERYEQQKRDPFYQLGKVVCNFMGWN